MSGVVVPTRGTASRRGAGPAVWLAAAFLVLLAVAVLAPQVLAPGNPLATDPPAAFTPPGPAHWFGTDASGRDVATRVVHGARASLTIGVLATAIGVGLGLALGLLGARLVPGLAGRVLDTASTRFTEVMLAFPGLVLALFVITLYGPGPVTVTIAVGLSTAPGYARIIRAQVRQVASSGYVEAERLLGRPWPGIVARTIVPNAVWPLVAVVTLGIGQAVVWASALSYLGFGVAPPAPEWGAMLSDGRTYLTTAWWMSVFPGLAIVATALATASLGRFWQRRVRER
ncbi:binding-protein-dependent transport systems inner membrane component [Beutenbergia cavernae DSM 12333]|uniref:Binding-protein-dependent transport systems inner membrane component n=1 Tax=Beutenbergia cavernae (strain ATCC BAA-8 / DSM 12333 / CCUG 43141 / JCM 11478 / NBRC 16432 / NCIMB 13614 / HKI 0122) TaxID=471853 RepID=C5C2B7_BEUC1|nr:ABC transporter permease [Beutenbergia cavernae]ACQ81742.1 binding-protein-dependent transport systems inner membrane component [Beutenbergia cavernae DSM 12333]